MADPKTPADLKHWTDLATKKRKGKDPAALVWHTPKGLDVKPSTRRPTSKASIS